MKLLLTWALMTAGALAQTSPQLLVVNKAGDSISVISTQTLTEEHRIPVGSNPHELAVAPNGRKAYVVNAGGNSISVIDLGSYAETRRITTPDFSFPHGIVFTPDSTRALVTSERSDKIIVIDAIADEVIRSIDTDQHGTHMATINRQGTWAYFSNRESNTISFMDLENYEIVANVPVGEGAEGFALSPDGGEIWVSDRAAARTEWPSHPTASMY
jgi:YVTN family beta-propeller protein